VIEPEQSPRAKPCRDGSMKIGHRLVGLGPAFRDRQTGPSLAGDACDACMHAGSVVMIIGRLDGQPLE